jgi:hypothetical protein
VSGPWAETVYRRIATRYDRRADVFLSAVALAATVNSRS